MTTPQPNNQDEHRVAHAMSIDDAYHVERMLARSAQGITELVTIDGAGPFVRKKIPCALARRTVWAALATCSNPGLPRVQATYETPDWFAVVLEFVPGETLEHIVEATGAMPANEAARRTLGICSAVEELHAHSIIHRDLSPTNVVANGDGVHLIDLGTARMTTEPASPNEPPFGTWGFAAPEQHGFAETDERSDIYAIGRLLGYLLTGARPDDQRFEQLLNDESVVPPRLRTVIERACAFEPSARYQSARELAAAIGGKERASAPVVHAVMPAPAAAAQPAPASASAVPTHATSKNTSARNRRMPIVFGAAVVAAIAVIGAVCWAGLNGMHEGPAQNRASVSEGSIERTAEQQPERGDKQQPERNDESASEQSDVAPSRDAASATAASTVSDASLELVESGWSPIEHGLVSYAFGVRNTSETETIDYPEVVITGRAADGAVVFSQPQALMSIAPGETLYFGGPAGSGTAPATVEFSVSAPSALNTSSAHEQSATLSTSPTVNAQEGSFGTVVFSGDVTMSEGAVPDLTNSVMVTIVLRDETGAIVYGATTNTSIPNPGQNAPFACEVYNPPAYLTIEAHAQFW